MTGAALGALRVAATLAVAGCGASGRGAAAPAAVGAELDDAGDEPGALAGGSDLIIRWRGARVGEAHERIEPLAGGGVRFSRSERVVVARAGVRVETRTELVVEASSALAAQRMWFRQRMNGATSELAAVRTRDGWQTTPPGARLPADAVPAPWVPVLVARRRLPGFDGAVLIPGASASVARLTLTPAGGSGRFAARLATSGGTLASQLAIDDAGATVRAVAGEVVLEQAGDDELARPFDPPDVVAATAIPVAGRGAASARLIRLELTGVGGAPPPPLPGQRIVAAGDRWEVTLGDGAWGATGEAPPAAAPAAPDAPDERGRLLAAAAAAVLRESGARSRRAQVAALIAYADRSIADDLAAPPGDAAAALASARGDCTAHAVLFVGLAAAAGIPARVVTGYRLDRDRLVRHRWALVEVDGRWLAVDPARGELPASAGHLALAVHGGSSSELAVVDETAFAGFLAARAMLR